MSVVRSENDVSERDESDTAGGETLPRQIKGILKQSNNDNSVTLHETNSNQSPYNTFVSATERWRHTITTITNLFSSEYTLTAGGSKKRVDEDMTLEEQRDWETQEMNKSVDFAQLKIDPAPFQLPEKSSLLKVHSLFSMLGIKIVIFVMKKKK